MQKKETGRELGGDRTDFKNGLLQLTEMFFSEDVLTECADEGGEWGGRRRESRGSL